jgi:lipoate-protein ligase A
VGMTSMANELEREISLDEVRNVLRDQLAVVLGISFETRNLDQISFDKLTC